MGQIRSMLDARNQQADHDRRARHDRIRQEVLGKLAPLGKAAIQKLANDGWMHRSAPGEYETVRFEGDNLAAWLLREWPKFDLLNSSVERYAVYLLESGVHVAIRRTSGVDVVERYHPDTYGDTLEEFLTVYVTTAKLPRNIYFEKEWTDFLAR